MKHVTSPHTNLTYHEVLSSGVISRYSVGTDEFAAHLRLLVGLEERSSCRPFLSFDDGHISNCLDAAPLLKQFGLVATFFVTAGFIESGKNYMSWSQVHDLLADGHSIQAHGWTHQFLTDCSDSELSHELTDAKSYLEDRTGQPVTKLSLPGGRYDERVLRFIEQAGYETVYSSDGWLRRSVTASLTLEGRIMVRRNTSTSHLEALARGTSLAKGVFHTERALRGGVRSIVGQSNYHALWTRASGRMQARPGPGQFLS